MRLSLDEKVTHHKTTDDVVVTDQRNRQVPFLPRYLLGSPTAGYFGLEQPNLSVALLSLIAPAPRSVPKSRVRSLVMIYHGLIVRIECTMKV